MTLQVLRPLTIGFAVAALMSFASVSRAHFPWLATDEAGHALLFFSEGMQERDYRLPESVEKAKVYAIEGTKQQTPVELARVEREGFNGLKSSDSLPSDVTLVSHFNYGAYQGTLLCYYVKHTLPTAEPSAAPEGELKLNATPVQTKHGVDLHVVWNGKPLPGAEVAMTDSKGQQASKTTNMHGVVKFISFAAGPVGFIIGHVDEDAPGTVDGQKYTSESHYLTLTTVNQPGQAKKPAKADSRSVSYPELPAPIASFGAAVADGWLYVYSGHTGAEHEHSRDNLSGHFCRLNLEGGEQWEELPMQTPLQGLPLVAHDGKLYRVGGLNSRNAADEDEDMHSTDEFACFDPDSGRWTALPPLPEPRSSHDAVVIGDKLYVVGGWQLSGASPGEWRDTAWSFDLAHPNQGWEAIEQPPFRRRALALSQLDGKLVVLGGMDEDRSISDRADCYDPVTKQWSELPNLPGKNNGFGLSAWSHDGRLYLSGMEGVVYSLSPGAKEWQQAGKLDDPRFFHRLLSAGPNELLVVAGASTEQGHVGTLEVVPVSGQEE